MVRLKLDVQGQGGGRILDVDGQEGWGVLKIGQFLWTSYVYCPLSEIYIFILGKVGKIIEQSMHF